MIIYFSGTGNSRYIAKKIAEEVGVAAVDLFEKIKNEDYSEMYSDSPWIVVAPTYAWRLPRILEQWLIAAKLSGNKDVYFVMTCGGSIGNAGKYLKILCDKKGLNHRGCSEIVMPENYIALFRTPSKEEAIKTIEKAQKSIDNTIFSIKKGVNFPEPKISIGDRINSGIVNVLFYPTFVHAKKFFATDSCVSCGICANMCPLNNVKIENGKPKWGEKCTHCMACICRCPKEAIEYGKHSEGLPRYTCPK